jgi:hypothetical protein
MTTTTLDQDALPTEQTTPDKTFFDRVLGEGEALDDLVLEEASLTGTIQKLLGLSAAGLAVHMALVGSTAQTAQMSWAIGGSMPMLWLPLAYILGFGIALGICLPSFYFYTQLAGLDASFRLITAQALRVQARTSVILLGLAPVYAALALGAHLGFEGLWSIETVAWLGLTGPFVIGLFGVISLYKSFGRLRERIPVTHPRRGDIVLRLVICWGAVFLATAPVAVWRMAQWLSGIL